MNAPATPAPAVGLEIGLAEQVRMVAALRGVLQASEATAPAGAPVTVELIETHISFVLVGGAFAYKFKKAVAPGFLDFTTLALRRHFCEEELRLNRRLAPALYLEVVPVTGPVEAPRLGGPGPVIDWVVRMRAFAQQGLWDRLAARGELTSAHVDELLGPLCRFHEEAAPASAASRFGEPGQVRAPMLDNLEVLSTLLHGEETLQRLARLRRWEAAEFALIARVLQQRRRAGRVRECHGDLHLGNVAVIDGRSTVFDCIEFNDDFRWIDVMSEIAFMAMDLQEHGLGDLAHRFVNGYLEHSGDYAGARVLRYYTVHRALVRAKVAALRARQAGASADDPPGPARVYLELAERCSRGPDAALMITHGLSGSGKTTGTQTLLEHTGAIRIRSDVERKRLAGLQALAHTGSAVNAGLYAPDATAATYARLCELAVPVLEGGYSVILDATFLKRVQREMARQLAARLQVPFVILDFGAETGVLRERLLARAASGRDASEADLQVLLAQQRAAEPLAEQEMAEVVRGPAFAAGEGGAPARAASKRPA